MDANLLMSIAQNYDLVVNIVTKLDGECLVRINPEEICEFFGLKPFSYYHVAIDLLGMEKEYFSKRDKIRQGALWAHLVSIGNFSLLTTSTREPFKTELFISKAIEICMTLCSDFGKDEQNFMPIKFMYMMA